MNGKCYVYDCSNRNYYGYCKTTACINPKYNKITNSTRDAADTFVAKPKTNADRIRSMTDEELAEWFGNSESMCPDGFSETNDCDACPEVCTGHWLQWLKEEVKE